ncbi:MAG TPA: VanZ family protein [Acidobacteriota bacterium]|nr:VanZ family protein [Acidobacteriota bacterium]
MLLRYWIPSFAWAVAIFSLSHMSSPPGASLGPDYVLHFLEYGIFAVTVVWGITSGLRRELTLSGAALSWLAVTAYAATDEFHQRFVPGRFSSIEDLLADAAGAACFVTGCYLVLTWRQRNPR